MNMPEWALPSGGVRPVMPGVFTGPSSGIDELATISSWTAATGVPNFLAAVGRLLATGGSGRKRGCDGGIRNRLQVVRTVGQGELLAARRMVSRGGSVPVQISSDAAPCLARISRPSTTVAPAARAATIRSVSRDP